MRRHWKWLVPAALALLLIGLQPWGPHWLLHSLEAAAIVVGVTCAWLLAR